MGKVTIKELPKDHPIFKAGWLISTVRNQSQKIKQYEEERAAEKPKKIGCQSHNAPLKKIFNLI